MDLESSIRSIVDYPAKGIIFRDITTLLKDPEAFREAVDQMVDRVRDLKIDKVVAMEARGFILGAPIAYKLGCGFVPVRKPGKLPYEKVSTSYSLEYGDDSVEMHIDALKEGERVLIVDDLLATGGTTLATINLVEKLGGVVECCLYLIELVDLPGREKIGNYKVESILEFKEN